MKTDKLLYGINQEIWDRILWVLRSEMAVSTIILFGSRAKGNYKYSSDIDLCLKAPNLSDRSLKTLLVNLDELNLPWKIDLLRYEDIKEVGLIEHIDRVGIEL